MLFIGKTPNQQIQKVRCANFPSGKMATAEIVT